MMESRDAAELSELTDREKKGEIEEKEEKDNGGFTGVRGGGFVGGRGGGDDGWSHNSVATGAVTAVGFVVAIISVVVTLAVVLTGQAVKVQGSGKEG